MRDLITFLRNFATRFHHTGAVAPSSAGLARAITSRVGANRRPGEPLTVMEVGPGTGAFTRVLLAERLRPGDRLDLFEINAEFCDHLRASVLPAAGGVDVRLSCADILAEAPVARYDAIVSGLPFNNFEPRVVESILSLYLRLLAPGGTLSFFEYLAVRPAKLALLPAGGERDRIAAIDGVVAGFRRRFGAGEERVLLNLPPARAVFMNRPAIPGER